MVEHALVEKLVVFKATVFRFTKIEIRISLKSEANKTTVYEEIRFTSPYPIKIILRNIFKKNHEQLFKNIALA